MTNHPNRSKTIPFHNAKFAVPASQAPAVGDFVRQQSLTGRVVHVGRPWQPGPDRGTLFSIIDESTGHYSGHGYAGKMRPGSRSGEYANVVEMPDDVQICYVYVRKA